MDWENHSEKNRQLIKKLKTLKTKTAASEKKTTSEKAKFCLNTVFSLCFHMTANKFHAANHSLFRSTLCSALKDENA